jgi:ABC-type uncharacterized transport system substrate-binding protein
MNAVMDALAAHTTMSKQAIASERVREGPKDVLLGPAQLYEALLEKAAEKGGVGAGAARACSRCAVFMVPEDPVRLGLVTNLARPGGNATGVNFFAAELAGKRLEMLVTPLPAVKRIAVLLNPSEPTIEATNRRDVEAAVRAMGLQLRLFNASSIAEIDAALRRWRTIDQMACSSAGTTQSACSSTRRFRPLRRRCGRWRRRRVCSGSRSVSLSASTESEIETAFATLVAARTGAVSVTANPFLNSKRAQVVALAARHAIPALYEYREAPLAGGLMSYGPSIPEVYRQIGIYAGRILKGEKPADLPVVQPTRIEMVINLKTARALGLDVPPTLLARADEVIE